LEHRELESTHAALTADYTNLLETHAEEMQVAHQNMEKLRAEFAAEMILLERISTQTNVAQEDRSLRVQQTQSQVGQ